MHCFDERYEKDFRGGGGKEEACPSLGTLMPTGRMYPLHAQRSSPSPLTRVAWCHCLLLQQMVSVRSAKMPPTANMASNRVPISLPAITVRAV